MCEDSEIMTATAHPLRLLPALAVALATAAGCSEPAAEELDTTSLASSTGGVSDVLRVIELSDSLFAFDPTLDPTLAPDANAMAIGAHAEASS